MNRCDRRRWMQAASLGLFGASASGWLPALADQLATDPRRKRHCILLWMNGGPSQTDTFDMKPGHEHGGEFKEIATSVPGLRFCEHLPKLSTQADKLAVVRSLNTKEGDHGRGTYLMRTGRPPMGPIRYPAIGAALARELGSAEDAVPSYVSIAPYRAFSLAAYQPGFLGPKHAPLVVGATDVSQAPDGARPAPRYAELTIDAISPPAGVDTARLSARKQIWESLQERFLDGHPTHAPRAQDTIYRAAMRLMESRAARAFDLSEEPDTLRDSYGTSLFGQGCLMARRLVERGTAFVEVSLGVTVGNLVGWDTHANNFRVVQQLCGELDAAWSTLLEDLQQRGLLETTTILWLGEFGRTPQINAQAGRDHFPTAWTCVLAGGGIQGGQAYGKTSPDGMQVEEGQVGVGDVLATLCAALGVPPDKQNLSNTGRPVPIVEGTPIRELLASR